MTYPETWLETAKRITLEPGKTVVLGESDTGKTSLSTLLANLSYAKEMKTAILDLDPGQSHIGPPATIGLAVVKAPLDQSAIIEPTSMWFVGSNSPTLAIRPIIEGVKMLLHQAEKLNIDYLVVDTSGYIRGRRARKFKLKIISIIKPSQIVVLERENELNQLAEEVKDLASIYRVRVSQMIRKKSKRERREFRVSIWRFYLKGARPLEIEKGKLLNMLEPTILGYEGTVVGLFNRASELVGVGVVSRVIDDRVVILTRSGGDEVEWVKFGRVKVAKSFLI